MSDETTLSTIVTSKPMDLAMYAWLDEHGRHRNEEGEIVHTRTSKAYEDTMLLFRNSLKHEGFDLDSKPGEVALIAQLFMRYSARDKEVTPATKNQRLSVLSSFYEYCKRKGPESAMYLEHNPIDQIKRAKVQEYASAQPLPDTFVVKALASIDQNTLHGKRDYALLSVLLYTGRRAQEMANLTWSSIVLYEERATITTDAKGDVTMIDTLPIPVTNALMRWIRAYYGNNLETLAGETPIWVSLAHDASNGKQLGYLSINAICKKHLGTSKVHATRHTFAHSMEAIGAPVSEIQARLGHKSLATTGRYLASLKRAENRHGEQLAALYGIE